MAAPKTTVWPLDPHTAAKHAILRRYLSAWLLILSQASFAKLVYVDAFAGPGAYAGGEDGSPIIALKELVGHRTQIKARACFHFVELDVDRAAMLAQQVTDLLTESRLSGHVEANVHQSSFEEAYPTIQRAMSPGVVPTFAFIDAFGWTGFPFAIVRDILRRRSCEVLINFMYEEINRFLSLPDQEENFDKLFGCPDWRACIAVSRPAERNRALRELYGAQLRKHAKYVRTFEMRNRANTVDYYLFFATNDLTGLKRMKEAMWKVDTAGDYVFSDATDQAQSTLFSEPDFAYLRRLIIQRFQGQQARIEDIETFVLAETAFRETHFKQQILKPLEAEGKLEIARSREGRRTGTFPAGTVIRFL